MTGLQGKDGADYAEEGSSSNTFVGYTYDSGNRLQSVTQQGATCADQFDYARSGQLASYRTGLFTHTVAYDNRQRVQRLTAGVALDLTYDYDRTSQVLRITDQRPGESQSFEYDGLVRLKTALGSWGSLAWTYDASGNRLSESGPSGSTSFTYSTTTLRRDRAEGSTQRFGATGPRSVVSVACPASPPLQGTTGWPVSA